MKRTHQLFAAVMLATTTILTSTSGATAQLARPATSSLIHTSSPLPQLDTVQATESQLLFAGFLGAIVGFGVGAAAGYGLEMTTSRTCIDYCGLSGAFVGMFLGESLGLALGTHLTNDRQGPFLATSTASMAIAAMGLVVATHIDTGRARTPILLAIPITQLLIVTGMEQRAQRRSPER
jgi:hypothetical protein